MPPNDRVRQLLTELVELLEKHDEPSLARAVALSTAEGKLDAFLTSNELWGGAGSIADQAGMKAQRTPARREIERVLIDLGTEQVNLGKVNPRTAGWVKTFVEWRQRGI